MRFAIIEDEAFIAADLVHDLQTLRPAWQLVAVLDSVKKTRDWLASRSAVDLIFSDIQLGDGTCFDAFAVHPPAAPVIFCTAYDQYALQAFQHNGIGYLLKPYSLPALQAAIEKVERLRPDAPDIRQLLEVLRHREEPHPVQRILVHHKDKIIPVPMEEVALFYLHHEQTMLLRMDGQRFPIQSGLTEVEAMAGPAYFRANRQHLVARAAILDATQYFARKLLLNLRVSFEEQVIVSKEKSPAFLEWFGR